MRNGWIALLTVGLLLASFDVAFAKKISSVKGLEVNNAHFLTERKGLVYRGAQPTPADVEEMAKFGITDVLIIKKDNKGEVAKEIDALQKHGISGKRVNQFDIMWNELSSAQANCEHFVEALKIVEQSLATSGSKLYLHCTQGEDRTGLISGLVRMLEDGWTMDQAFQEEMCARGYAEGGGKPADLNGKIHDNLTPLFMFLGKQIQSGSLKWRNLNKSVCRQLPKSTNTSMWKCR